MKIIHDYSSNHFPYIAVEVLDFKEEAPRLFYTYAIPAEYNSPRRGYISSVCGIWRIKYKIIDEHKSCESQGLEQIKYLSWTR